MSMNELTAQVRELKELRAMRDELEAEITSIEDVLKAEMEAKGAEEMVVDVYKLKYSTVKVSRFNTAAFKATHSALYDQYTTQKEIKRFCLA